jgi:hypothetical protein
MFRKGVRNTASLIVTGLLNTVTVPRSAQNSFYRLKRPLNCSSPRKGVLPK